MIIEALTAALTPTRTALDGAAKRLGLVHEAVGIAARHRRHRRAWRGHLKTCRRIIASVISQVPSSGRIVILGSGTWLDLPVRALDKHGAAIHLYDIVHLPPTRLRARLHPTFSLHTLDLTGFIAPWDAWDGSPEGSPLPPDPARCQIAALIL